MCFLRRSRLPFGRPQKPQTPPQAYMPQPCVCKGVQSCRLPAFKLLNRPASLSKATTFAATGPSHVFFTAFEAAVWPASNRANPSNCPAGFVQTSNLADPAGAYRRPLHRPQKLVIHRLSWAYVCSGTYHFVFLHGLPAGVSCLT